MTGIYQIQSIVHPDRIYIGSAVDINKRWIQHKSKLSLNQHENSKLQNHFNKYGEVDLVFTFFYDCTKEELIKEEQFFITCLDPWFNICKIAGSNFGRRYKLSKKKSYSEETKEKHRNLMLGNKCNLGKKVSEETIKLMKRIHVGENNAMLGKHHSIKTKLILSEKKMNKYPSDKTRLKMSEKQRDRWKLRKETNLISKERKRITVVQLDKNRNFIRKFESMEEVYRVLNILPSKVSCCINHKKNRNTAGGYIWEKETNFNISTIYPKPI